MPEIKDGEMLLAKRAYVKDLVERYPDITKDEKEILIRWYRKEASSLDVALLSQSSDVSLGYSIFKKEMDRLGLQDYIVFVAITAIIVLFFAMIIYNPR